MQRDALVQLKYSYTWSAVYFFIEPSSICDFKYKEKSCNEPLYTLIIIRSSKPLTKKDLKNVIDKLPSAPKEVGYK